MLLGLLAVREVFGRAELTRLRVNEIIIIITRGPIH